LKTEKLEKAQDNWRQKNIQKARLARAEKIKERKLQEVSAKLDELSLTVDDKVEKEVEEKVKGLLKAIDSKKIKSDFYEVFYKVGGVKGMVTWIKNSIKNRGEYYKLLISLLKTESIKQQPTQRQGVILNIIAPSGEKKEIEVHGRIESETSGD